LRSLDFESYADAATCEICDGAIREKVREELLTHMEEKADDFASWGASPEEAVRDALRDMGDAEPVSGLFGEIHSRLPRIRLRSAIDKVSAGLFLMFFSIDVWHIKYITTAIGMFLLFAGLFQLRHADGKLRMAFILMTAVVVINAEVGILLVLPASLSISDSFWIKLSGIMPLFCCLCCLFSGLAALAGPSTASARHNVSSCSLAYLILIVLAAFGDSLGNLGFILGVIIIIYILIQVRKVRDLLWKQGKGSGMKNITPLGRALLIAAAILLFASSPVASYLTATETPEATFYSIHDAGANVDDIRAHLHLLGMDEALLSDLPDSEVLKLSNTEKVYMSYLRIMLGNNEPYWNKMTMAIALCEASGYQPSRLILSADWDTPPKKAYRDGFFLLLQQNDISAYALDTNDTWTFSIFERGGKTYSMPVLNEFDHANAIATHSGKLLGIEFRVLPDATRQRVLYSMDYDANDIETVAPKMSVVYIHRTAWFISPFEGSVPYRLGEVFANNTRPGFEQHTGTVLLCSVAEASAH